MDESFSNSKKRTPQAQHKKHAGHGHDASSSPSPQRQLQLQGSTRVVRDHCADWHNHIDKWGDLNNAGFNIINKIINLKLQAKSEKETNIAVNTSQGTVSEYLSERHDGMPEGLNRLCEELKDVFSSLAGLVEKMKAITRHFHGVERLEEKRGSERLFQAWSVKQFVKSSEDLEAMYSQELQVKRTILEDVAHHDDRDTLMMYASCWLHQAYIEDEATVILESMLTETGFR